MSLEFLSGVDKTRKRIYNMSSFEEDCVAPLKTKKFKIKRGEFR